MNDDPVAQRLREAVWADPSTDAPRMVYADYLLEHDSPLGELISLQLQRSRTGDAITEHELELVTTHGRRLLDPATVWLYSWVLERGFLHSATPVERSISLEAAHHPLWSTVERIALIDGDAHPVLDNPHLRSLRTLNLGDRVAARLAMQTVPLPCRALSGGSPHVGLGIERPETFDHRGAFDHVRELSLEGWSLEGSPSTRGILDRRLFGQLDYLDLTFSTVGQGVLATWRAWFDASELTTLSVQLPFGIPEQFAHVEIDQAGNTAVVQLEAPSGDRITDLVSGIVELAGPRTRIEVEDVRDSNHCAERHVELITALRSSFVEVVIASGPVRLRAP